MNSLSTMQSSHNFNASIIKKEEINNFKDISDRLKKCNQKYCTDIRAFMDQQRTNCEHKIEDLRQQKDKSIIKDLTYHKSMYLFSTSYLNVIPKPNFEEKICECRYCETEKTKVPLYKCAECQNFYYCQNCFFLCLDKHPHNFLPAERSQEMKMKQSEIARLNWKPVKDSKYNSLVINKNDLIKKMKYGSLEEFEVVIKFKNTGEEEWKKNQIFIDYTKDSEIRKYKSYIGKGCKVGEVVEVRVKIPEMKTIYPGHYIIKLCLLLPNSNDKFFGDPALIKIIVEL